MLTACSESVSDTVMSEGVGGIHYIIYVGWGVNNNCVKIEKKSIYSF